MARKFGGKFSPNESSEPETIRPSFEGAKVNPVGARSNVLFVPPVVLAFTSITAGAAGMAIGLLGAAFLVLGAWLLRDGLKAEAAYKERRVARRPSLPRKVLASVATGLGIAIAAYKSEPGILAPVIYGAAAFGLQIAAFGIDPMRNKGMEGIDTFQQDRVARVVDEAETYLSEMKDAILRAGDRSVEARVERFQVKVSELIRTVEEDPRDLTAAKKFLGVYLMGARDASVKFADVYSRTQDKAAKSDYMMLLTDLEESFGAKTRKLLLDNNSDLTVEIDVLRDRLQREGVRLDRG